MGFDSLFVGVSGLEAYQNQLDVISNNIANVSTTGYKEQNVNFEDLLYQASQYATAPTTSNGGVNGENYGLGVKVGSIDTNFSQGGMTTTGVNTNLAINGDGFFILDSSNGSSAPVYTRNGDFSLNENGLLYDPSSGLAVQGWMADAQGAIAATGVPGDITIPLGLTQQAVGTGLNASEKFGPTGDQVFDASYSGNLDQTNWAAELASVEAGNPPASGAVPETITTTLYDSLGNAHTATITYTPDASGAIAGTDTIPANPALADTLINTAGVANNATATTNVTVTVNSAGTSATVTDTLGNSVTVLPGGTATIDGVTIPMDNFSSADAGDAGTLALTNGNPAVVGANPVLAGNIIASVNAAASTFTGALTGTVNGTGTSMTITDGTNTVSGIANSTVTIDGVQIKLGNFGAADAGAAATIDTTAGSSGLPATVDNTAGVAEAPSTRWQVSVSFTDGTTFDTINNPGQIDPATGDVDPPTYSVASSGVIGYTYFNQNGQYINSSALIGATGATPGGALTTANGAVHVAGAGTTLAAGDQLNVESWGTGDLATAPTSGASPTGAKATVGPIGIDYSDLSSLAEADSVTTLAQNGYAAGTLDNITIGTNGIITGAFTNGQNATLGQVAVATFQNEDGLAQIGSSQFSETANSGLAQIGTAASGQYGTINSGDLEQSNVDLASEFTKMIAAQNAYQANSKSITVASQDIQTAVNLIPGG
ncbi:MAG: flagellar hook-basal body complex protein [Vulcanimicrobiaceae bacterium]